MSSLRSIDEVAIHGEVQLVTIRRTQPKVGRNEPCPCGSQKKYKHCHGQLRASMATDSLPPGLEARLAAVKALHKRRQQQQGLGRPIVSTVFGEYRIVAVRNQILWSKNWKTFEDFLLAYIRYVLGRDWGQREIQKPLIERHPILQCYDRVCHAQRASGLGEGQVKEMVATGAVMVYLHLAYYLYVIDHNAEVQKRLLQRLRNRSEFQAARYETAVAALFTLAGFSIEFENEGDATTTHVEFTATHLRSGRKYSVECKSKHRRGLVWSTNGTDKPPDVVGEVRDHLYRALKKRALHDRVVFIEINLPDDTLPNQVPNWAAEVDGALRVAERDLTVDGQPAPAAYVFVTNDTTAHQLDTTDGGCFVFASGFHMPDFHSGTTMTIREAVAARDRHRDIHSLGQSVRAWRQVPSTFDGEIPERTLMGQEAPWQIGQRYIVPIDDGSEAEGVLEEALMMERDMKVWGVFRLSDGRRVICTCPVDQEEVQIYRRYPDTYFGVVRHVGGELHTPVDMYDFFYNTYSQTPKEKLLEFMKTRDDLLQLQSMSQEGLAKLYCELLANDMLSRKLEREKTKR